MPDKSIGPGTRFPLVVYRRSGRRYRPAAVLLFLVGLLMLLPRLLALPLKWSIAPDTLATVGLVVLVGGVFLWILSLRMASRSFVQCRSQYLLIHAPFNRFAVGYSRVVSNQLVRIGAVYPLETLKGSRRAIMKSLLPESAVEVEINEWPVPERRLRRYFSPFLFSTRERGLVLIVPEPSKLNNEITSYLQNARDRRSESERRYLDPIERAQQAPRGGLMR